MPANPDPVDDDPEYAQDVADASAAVDDLPEATDPATIPADQGDANAELKEDDQ